MVKRQRFTAEFKREAARLPDAGVIRILPNLGGVTGSGYSSGLDDLVGELAGAHTTAANRGAGLKLANLPPVIKDETLAITQLITLFNAFDSEDEGVESFAWARDLSGLSARHCTVQPCGQDRRSRMQHVGPAPGQKPLQRARKPTTCLSCHAGTPSR